MMRTNRFIQMSKSWLNEWEDERDVLLSFFLSQDEPADNQNQNPKETKANA